MHALINALCFNILQRKLFIDKVFYYFFKIINLGTGIILKVCTLYGLPKCRLLCYIIIVTILFTICETIYSYSVNIGFHTVFVTTINILF